MNFINKVKKFEPKIIENRRHLHQNPELSGQEFETQKYIMKQLDELNIPYEKVGTTSLVGYIKGGKAGKTVALRADIDALPIIEQSGASYSSKKEGLMHACGHDGHTAMLLGAARMLKEVKDELPGDIKLLFQEGEENFTGAQKVIEDGGMDGVDAVFGMHGMPIDVGFYDIEPGYRMAGCDTIHVKFEGVSGHGSTPHLAKDTVLPAAEFVTQLNAMITKFVDSQSPLVLTVGKFDAGTKANIISKYAKLDISMRYLHEETRKAIHEKIYNLAKGLAIIYDIKIDVEIEESTISMSNDEKIAEIANKSAEKVFGPNKNVHGPIMMGSEDMPYYFQKAPGAYALVGYFNKEKNNIYFPHNEKFNIDENYMKLGAALHAQFAWDYLNENS
ncbi:M20 metallopeptidase family protein [Clostridium algidicarnis]|uniref:M20 metallopeptidase family protein n=1 Tax=Clostridium algidicarnis TaxID=37659 RepID=UPI001C0B2761|nr:amidohydrolase [Clostridium algidicarnis]MBU3204344.1 amidohydrolase [Clostridium algidicarnis]MBU3212572.1 amidohydrolase [Clostridium algidicarnis]MBU3223003.1 amidohydrolase [Clostridium algidicarnis]